MPHDYHDRVGDGQSETAFPANGGATLARFDRPQGSGTTIAVVADPHLTATARGSLKVYHRTKQRFQMAVADAHRLDVDGVVVAGDLTKDGTTSEFELADELLATAPEPTHVLPGNHDVTGNGPVSSGREFADRYGYDKYPTVCDLQGLSLVPLDSTLDGSGAQPGGRLAAVPSDRLQRRLDGERLRIAVLHHPIAPIPDPLESVLPESEYRIQDPAETADALVDAGIDVVVTAHLHWPYATEYRGLQIIGAPSCSSFPPAYLLVHLDSRGTTVTIVPLAGQAGLREAYEYAVANHQRGDAIRSAVENDYFRQFPMVDQQRAFVGDGAASLTRTAGN
jgi:Icc protein